MEGLSFLPGFCFKPSDEELLNFYLWPKVSQQGLSKVQEALVPERENLYDEGDPSNIFDMNKDAHYCFVRLQKATASGGRVKRKVPGESNGTWTSQSSVDVTDESGRVIGLRKLLTFRVNKATTKWNMYEYSLPDWKHDDWVLCKILHSNKNKKRNTPDSPSDFVQTFGAKKPCMMQAGPSAAAATSESTTTALPPQTSVLVPVDSTPYPTDNTVWSQSVTLTHESDSFIDQLCKLIDLNDDTGLRDWSSFSKASTDQPAFAPNDDDVECLDDDALLFATSLEEELEKEGEDNQPQDAAAKSHDEHAQEEVVPNDDDVECLDKDALMFATSLEEELEKAGEDDQPQGEQAQEEVVPANLSTQDFGDLFDFDLESFLKNIEETKDMAMGRSADQLSSEWLEEAADATSELFAEPLSWELFNFQ